MSKEKEELADIIAKEIREGQTAYTVAKKIQQLGYTKTHSPIEKLEEWLKRQKRKCKEISNNPTEYDYWEREKAYYKSKSFQNVLDKIQELKGDIEVDNNG